MKSSLEKLINVNPQICHGKPVFTGTRILVSDILELLEADISSADITSRKYFPQLTPHHIRAALHFAASQLRNREFIAFTPN